MKKTWLVAVCALALTACGEGPDWNGQKQNVDKVSEADLGDAQLRHPVELDAANAEQSGTGTVGSGTGASANQQPTPDGNSAEAVVDPQANAANKPDSGR